jgi:glycosyltransferase involved in cell wall biosynthesis
MNKHIISIIIPTFNRAHLISETLDSIIAQTYTYWECIVVDDGSTDDTEKVLQEYILKDERFQYYQRPDLKPKGACSCRNYGFSLSKGEYVNWFDDDDIMHYDFLQSKLSKFKYCDVDVVISKSKTFKDSLNNIIPKANRTYESNNILVDFVKLKRSWITCDPLWKKSFLYGINLFDVSLKKGQDRDFHIRMLFKKPEILFVNEFLTYYRCHDNQISNIYTHEVALSLNNNLFERFQLFKNYSTEVTKFTLKEIYRNFRFINNQVYFIKIFKLSINNIKYLSFSWFFRFILYSISYFLFKKGYRILR